MENKRYGYGSNCNEVFRFLAANRSVCTSGFDFELRKKCDNLFLHHFSSGVDVFS